MLYKWSYENLLLLSRATPSYDTDKEEKQGKKWDERLDANNPDNFNINPNSDDDEEYIV